MASTSKISMDTTVEELKQALAAKEAEISALTAAAKRSATIEQKNTRKDLHRRVKVFVPKSVNGDKEPIVIRVNGYTAMIRRGATVGIPYFAALALQESLDADDRTEMMIERYESDYTGKSGQI